jgi:hypothetical protein
MEFATGRATARPRDNMALDKMINRYLLQRRRKTAGSGNNSTTYELVLRKQRSI